MTGAAINQRSCKKRIEKTDFGWHVPSVPKTEGFAKGVLAGLAEITHPFEEPECATLIRRSKL